MGAMATRRLAMRAERRSMMDIVSVYAVRSPVRMKLKCDDVWEIRFEVCWIMKKDREV